MLITCMLVTCEARRAWLPAWAEQVRRQTYRPLETVIIDSSPSALVNMPDVPAINYLHAPGASIGAQRNLALSRASGAYCAWFDDDDSHACHRLALLHDSLGGAQGADIVTPTRLAFAHWQTRLCHIFTENHRPVNVSALYRTSWVKRHRFPERHGPASELPWLQAIMPGAKIVRLDELLSVAWCHDRNISNPAEGSRWVFDQEVPLARERCLMPLR